MTSAFCSTTRPNCPFFAVSGSDTASSSPSPALPEEDYAHSSSFKDQTIDLPQSGPASFASAGQNGLGNSSTAAAFARNTAAAAVPSALDASRNLVRRLTAPAELNKSGKLSAPDPSATSAASTAMQPKDLLDGTGLRAPGARAYSSASRPPLNSAQPGLMGSSSGSQTAVAVSPIKQEPDSQLSSPTARASESSEPAARPDRGNVASRRLRDSDSSSLTSSTPLHPAGGSAAASGHPEGSLGTASAAEASAAAAAEAMISPRTAAIQESRRIAGSLVGRPSRALHSQAEDVRGGGNEKSSL